jgi:hypothetical protein
VKEKTKMDVANKKDSGSRNNKALEENNGGTQQSRN